MTDPYDLLPYTSHAFAESHPDRFAVVARLSGWEPPAIARARVLEIGCARGGNLLPMAASMPEATLVGIDQSARQIDEVRRAASEMGLANVTLHAASFEGVEIAPASFDFVIAHGVFSWIAPDARRALLAFAARALSPGGVAYVSFNVLPGWYERMATRDWIRFAARMLGDDDPTKSARWIAAHASPREDAYKKQLARVAARLETAERAYVAHEYLAEEHHPLFVGAFLDEIARAGLAYLGDAIAQNVALEMLDDEARARAETMEVRVAQQLVDFVQATSFRRALLVRAEDARGWRWPARLDPRAIDGLSVASRLRPSSRAELFEGSGRTVQVLDPDARAALVELARVAPRALPLRALPGSPDRLREELFDLWLADVGVDLHAHEPPFTTTPGARPRACPVARWQAANGGPITNRWHQEVALAEDVVRRVLARLDGSRTREEIARELGALPIAIVEASVDLLARSSLLVA